ncbi:hypothetical protein BMF94_5953 [Rhodotorula taiwanensis]|uniref:Ribosomal protein/NADH dehydrogenase domain-containing protein n=1 Tax=Rhodotorula taiwanensis TaxID=741276 RepID=A0A2S5B2M2_9BASI|nr:hypothetical protein BMF94_5953 [Rhodotorula taiwanensis]
MSGLRQARKTTQLASQLQQIVAGPSSRQLPSIVEGLTIRSEGVKGNAGARHFVKSTIPAVRFANPSLRISFEQVPVVTKKKRRTPPSPAEVEGSAQATEPTAEVATSEAAWTQPPGLTVTFTDPSLPPAFFPLPPQKSDRLVSTFWSTFGQEETVRAWATGKASAAGPESGAETVQVVDEVPVKGDGETLVGGEPQARP